MAEVITVQRRIEIFENVAEKMNIRPEFKKWLVDNKFFTQAASTKYHGAYEGGLFDHSLEVMKVLVDMTKKLNLEWERPESPYIVGLFHDLCKIDNYIIVEDDPGEVMFGSSTPKNRQVHFEYNPNTILKGHGDKSVMLLSQFINLTEEEMLCIRFHMGAYEGQDQWDNYDKAIRKYETVLWTHTADMYASKVSGV